MMQRILIWVLVVLCSPLSTILLADLARAKTLYVDASTGSDAWPYASNDVAHPWATIGRAAWGSTSYASPNSAQAAQAGDTVSVNAGIYTTGGSTAGAAARFDVALSPINSGTSGNPITFRGVGLVYVRMNGSSQGPMIGCKDGTSYVTWDHFQIDDTYGGSVGDTGPVFFGDSTGCQLLNSDISGHNGSFANGQATYTNNYNAVRLEHAVDALISDNYIHRVWGINSAPGAGTVNDAGIMTYSTVRAIIQYNTIFDTGMAIEFKGVTPTIDEANQHDNIARFNFLYSNNYGIRIMLSQNTKVYQNIVKDTSEFALMFGYDGSSVPTSASDAIIANNTVYNQTDNFTGAVAPDGVTMRRPQFRNNILHTVRNAYLNLGNTSPAVQTSAPQSMQIDRNLIYNANSFAKYNQDFGGSTYSFATWQGTYGLDINGSNGIDPQFVSATPSAVGDFKLQNVGQSARTMGRDVLDLNADGSTTDTIPVGAYITGTEEIGVRAGGYSSGGGGSGIVGGPTWSPINLRRQ